MLDVILSLARGGQWQDVIQLGVTLLSVVNGDERGRVHLYMAAAHASLALTPDEWRKAYYHASAARECSTPGGLVHTWSLQKLSSILVDMGHPGQARWFAHAYLKAAPIHPDLERFTGYVLRDLGIASMREKDYRSAIKWYGRSLRQFAAVGNDGEAIRARLHLVWAYCMAGKPGLARLEMPPGVPDHLLHFYYSAHAVLSAAEGHWKRAVGYVNLSLDHPHPNYDQVDAADICLLASRAVRRHGVRADAFTYEQSSAVFAARQGYDLRMLLVLTSEQRGGEIPNATATRRGSADLHHRGCYTTGIA